MIYCHDAAKFIEWFSFSLNRDMPVSLNILSISPYVQVQSFKFRWKILISLLMLSVRQIYRSSDGRWMENQLIMGDGRALDLRMSCLKSKKDYFRRIGNIGDPFAHARLSLNWAQEFCLSLSLNPSQNGGHFAIPACRAIIELFRLKYFG